VLGLDPHTIFLGNPAIDDTEFYADSARVFAGGEMSVGGTFRTYSGCDADMGGNVAIAGTLSVGTSIDIDGTNDKITATSGTIDFDNENLTTTGQISMGSFEMITGASNGFVLTSDASGVGTWQAATGGGWVDDGAVVRLQTITDDVGIGTASPNDKLEVNGAIRFGTDVLVVNQARAYTTGVSGLVITGEAGSSTDFDITESAGYSIIQNPAGTFDLALVMGGGDVGVGTTSPTEKLDVDGTARLRDMPTGAGTTVIVDTAGVLKKLTSSRRYKQNIRELEADTSLIFGLRPVRFEWKTTGEQDIGLIAEEVEKMLPDLVIYDNQGRPDAVKYDKVAIYLLAAIKELKAENEALKAMVEQVLTERQGSASGDNKMTINR